MNPTKVYLLAIAANISYSTASLFYSMFAQRFSSYWINQIKALIAFICFFGAMYFFENVTFIPVRPAGLLLLSGLFGLCLGDIMVFKSFTTLGASRTLVLYTFQPLLLGLYGFIFLHQKFTLFQSISVLCMILCIYIFMLERNKLVGSWDIKSFLWALGGISLDAAGVMMSREAYESVPELEAFQANMIRCAGALLGFFFIKPRSFGKLFTDIFELEKKTKFLLFITCFLGCFFSLWLYLSALKYAHVGTLTAITITGPVWVSFIDCLYHKKWPSPYLIVALILFISGVLLMIN